MEVFPPVPRRQSPGETVFDELVERTGTNPVERIQSFDIEYVEYRRLYAETFGKQDPWTKPSMTRPMAIPLRRGTAHATARRTSRISRGS